MPCGACFASDHHRTGPAGVLSAARSCMQGRWAPGPMVALRPEHWRAFSYVMLNMVSATGIVFANKLVLSVLDFHFVRPPYRPCLHGCLGASVALDTVLPCTVQHSNACHRACMLLGAGVRAHVCA